MKAKHTPGPWCISGQRILAPSIGQEFQVAEIGTDALLPVDEANLYLIAAAPELLKEAKAFLKAMDDHNNSEDWDEYDQPDETGLRAAIAKAEGGAK